MLATRWINPLVRRNTKSLTKRSYATDSFDKFDLGRLDVGDLYSKWIFGHMVGGCAIGAIGLPWSHVSHLHTEARRTGEPVDAGEVFVKSLLFTPIGMFFGTGIGIIIGATGPVSYPIAGGIWLMSRNKQ